MWGRKGVAQNFNDAGELKITKRSAAIFYHHSIFLQSLTIYLLSFATFSAVFDFEVKLFMLSSHSSCISKHGLGTCLIHSHSHPEEPISIQLSCWASLSCSSCPSSRHRRFSDLTVTHKKAVTQWAHSDSQERWEETLITQQSPKESIAFPVSSCGCCWTNASDSQHFIENYTRKDLGDYLFLSNAFFKPIEKSMHYSIFIPNSFSFFFFCSSKGLHVLFSPAIFFPALSLNALLSSTGFFLSHKQQISLPFFLWGKGN